MLVFLRFPVRQVDRPVLPFFAGPMPGIAGKMSSEGGSFSWLTGSVVSIHSWGAVGF